MKTLTILVTFLSAMSFSYSQQEDNICRTYQREGFTLEGRENNFQIEYSCPRNIQEFPYFGQLNYRSQQGLRCSAELGITSVYLTCRNRSSRARSARNVTITCCHRQVHGTH